MISASTLAAATQPASGGSSPVFLILIVVLAVVWIFMLRSNKRRKQTEAAKRESIEVGSKVVLSGGLIGTLMSRHGDRATVELAPGTSVEVMAGGILRTAQDPAPDDADSTERDDTDSTEPVEHMTGATMPEADDDDFDSTEPVDRSAPADGAGDGADRTDDRDASGSAITENGRRGRRD